MSYDITGKIGELYSIRNPEWPMYSFGRPAYILWNAIGEALTAKGWTEDQIRDWLQSKSPRWALDNDLGDTLRAIGKTYAEGLEHTNEPY